MQDFETLLPRLVATYETGRLVPFIGSGMSRRACTDWPMFIEALETAARLSEASRLDSKTPRLDSKTPRDVLIRRANSAVRTLKLGKPGAFAAAVRAGLLSKEPGTESIPPQTRALARIWWPLVLSTNYDNCYAAAFHGCFPERHLAVVGRSAEDCQRVLTSLSTAGRSLLWALQGYLRDVPYPKLGANVTPEPELAAQLAGQLVVGHEEYRRVTYRDLHFRRAFAEVFRQRSLLFLGAGLQENYLQELFGEVLEFYGPGARPHYAFIQKDEVDPDFMLARFQIVVVEYPEGKHGEIQRWLERLAEEVSRPRRTPVVWGWGRIDRSNENEWTSVPDLEVVRGPLPTEPAEGECLAVSAGGSGEAFFFSKGIRKVMEGWGVKEAMPSKVIMPYLGEFADRAVYAVRARAEKDERSLSHIYDASLAFFEHVAERYRCIRMQLLATGGQDKVGVSEVKWKVRNYPERFSFVQAVRAWAAWRKKKPGVDCRLALHVVLDSVYQDIASGRIDVLELLSCADIRFFVEVVSEAGEVERRLFQKMPDRTLEEVIKDLHLSAAQWTVKVTPPPSLDDRWLELNPETLKQTLQTLGVVPGSTVHFHRTASQH